MITDLPKNKTSVGNPGPKSAKIHILLPDPNPTYEGSSIKYEVGSRSKSVSTRIRTVQI